MRVIVVGAGGHGAVVADILQRAREAGASAVPLGFVDDTPSLQGCQVVGLPVLGALASLGQLAHDAIIVAIGDNEARREMTTRLTAAGERLATAIHPFAFVAPTARVGEGSTISAGALVLPRAELGRGVILNTKGSVDHDTLVGDFAHVSVGASVGARARIGHGAFIALGASVISGASVGARTVIGAGAVVVRDIPDDVVAWGVPARVTSR